MKKFLVILLAVAMIFGFAATAMAADTQIPDYSDKAATDKGGVAVYRLTALKILDGDGWGKAYRWADGLTRGELAKISCFLYLGESAKEEAAIAATLGANKYYTDVPAGYWGIGYINLATARGLMKGIGNGQFAPTKVVTMQEVGTVVLRALGYTDALPGVWPNDYNKKAIDTTLTKFVDYVPSQPISREELAILFNNALDMYIVEYVGTNDITAGMGYLYGIVDLDGFAYRPWATNEEDNLRKFFSTYGLEFATNTEGGRRGSSITPDAIADHYKYTSLGYKVFGILTVADQFTFNQSNRTSTTLPGNSTVLGERTWDYLEATGWGYKDFDKGELLFRVETITGRRNPVVGYAESPVATDYYIWAAEGADVTDLGARTGNLTYYVKDMPGIKAGEVVFVELTGKTVYDDEIKKDEYKNPAELMAVGRYGEIIYDKDDNIIFFDNYVPKVEDKFGIVDSVKNGKIVFETISNGYGPVIGSHLASIQFGEYNKVQRLNGGDLAFYCLTCKDFVDPETLQQGDVVYYGGMVGEAYLFLVIEPAEGKLTKVGAFDIEIDGAMQKAQFMPNSQDAMNSYVSTDNGSRWFGYYDEANYQRGLLGESIIWASSYVPNFFAFISDDLLSDTYGVITKIETDKPRGTYAGYKYTSVTILATDGAEYTYEFDQDKITSANILGFNTSVNVDLDEIYEGCLVQLYLKEDKVTGMKVDVLWNTYQKDLLEKNNNWFDGYKGVRLTTGTPVDGTNTLKINGIEGLYGTTMVLADDITIYSLTADKYGDLSKATIVSLADFMKVKEYVAWYAWTDDDTLYYVGGEDHVISYFMDLVCGEKAYNFIADGSYSITIGDVEYKLSENEYDYALKYGFAYGLLLAATKNEVAHQYFLINEIDEAIALDIYTDGKMDNTFKLSPFSNDTYKIYYSDVYTPALGVDGNARSIDGIRGAAGPLYFDANTLYMDVAAGKKIEQYEFDAAYAKAANGAVIVVTTDRDVVKYVLAVSDADYDTILADAILEEFVDSVDPTNYTIVTLNVDETNYGVRAYFNPALTNTNLADVDIEAADFGNLVQGLNTYGLLTGLTYTWTDTFMTQFNNQFGAAADLDMNPIGDLGDSLAALFNKATQYITFDPDGPTGGNATDGWTNTLPFGADPVTEITFTLLGESYTVRLQAAETSTNYEL